MISSGMGGERKRTTNTRLGGLLVFRMIAHTFWNSHHNSDQDPAYHSPLEPDECGKSYSPRSRLISESAQDIVWSDGMATTEMGSFLVDETEIGGPSPPSFLSPNSQPNPPTSPVDWRVPSGFIFVGLCASKSRRFFGATGEESESRNDVDDTDDTDDAGGDDGGRFRWDTPHCVDFSLDVCFVEIPVLSSFVADVFVSHDLLGVVYADGNVVP